MDDRLFERFFKVVLFSIIFILGAFMGLGVWIMVLLSR